MSADETPPLWRMAKLIRVVRTRVGTGSVMEIDGEVFPYFTADGFAVHPQRARMPSVTFTVLAERVEVIDDSNGDKTVAPTVGVVARGQKEPPRAKPPSMSTSPTPDVV